jgi:hypothetical protein
MSQRREFLKKAGWTILGAWAAGRLTFSPAPARASTPLPLLSETDQMAKTLGYHADASKVDTKKWSKRAGDAGKKQYCYNCLLFKAAGDVKASKQGKCTLFPKNDVMGRGWCNSWAQNPAVKD